MCRIRLLYEDGVWVQLPSPSNISISPALLWVIISVAAVFFLSGIFHILLRIIIKKQTLASISQSNRYRENPRPQSLGQQLQQLFRLHDSGLDQSFIDSLPVFEFKDVMGLNDLFNCAVCLCEFSPRDTLRLIPICSHAFHTHCIDTWLLSNSTCPLCRANLSENPLCNHNHNHNGPSENSVNVHFDSVDLEKRVLSVRLGKLKSFNGGERERERLDGGETSRCNLDARRCFSMGSFQYVVNDVDLQVGLFKVKDNVGCGKNGGNMDEKKIKYESFSVSKVWLWSKKGKFPVSSADTEVEGVSSSQNTIVLGL